MDDNTSNNTPATSLAEPEQQAPSTSLMDTIQAKASDMLDFHKHLNDYYQTANAAAHGDPNAQQQTAQNSLGMAMGTIQSVPEGAAEGLAAQGLEAAQHNLNAINEAAQAGKATAVDLARAQQIQGRAQAFAERAAAQKIAKRGYAEGGEVQQYAEGTPDNTVSSITPSQQPTSINVFNPEGDLGTLAPHQLPDALENGYTQASDQDVHNYYLQKEYGGVGQTLAATAEGAAQGATFGLSAPAELKAGITTPEDMARRAEANPLAHNIGQVSGLAASSLIPGVGEAEVLGKVGQVGAEALGLGKTGAGFLNQVAADTVKGAFEAALFQGTSEEIPRAFYEDPDKFAQSAIADIGLAGVMGGVFSGTIGAALRKIGVSNAEQLAGHPTLGAAPEAESVAAAGTKATKGTFVSELDMPAMEAGDLKTSIQNSNILKPAEKENIISGLSSLKSNSKEIEDAASKIGAPIAPGMLSDSKWVQKATDSLINGAPTYSGMKVAAKYSEGFNIANKAVEDVVGSEMPQYSKAELGNIMKTSIADQIKEQAAPIANMYNEIKKYHSFIPLEKEAVPGLIKDIEAMKEIKLSPSSPGSRLAKDVLSEIGNIKTVDDIKTYNSGLWDRLPPTASTSEKHMVSTISDALKKLENSSVESFANKMPHNDEGKAVIQSLIQQRKTADANYKPFIQKVQTLAEQLGKNRISGAQSAINFLQHELTPEQVTQKLFSKNNSEFLKFFKKEFPEQFELMRQYQKGTLRDEALSKTDGKLSPKMLFNKVNRLEPEIQKSLFTSDELAKLKAAETYLQAFPKNFNPSGTNGMAAFRQFFEHPVGATVSNLRDFGIEQFIKHVSASPEVIQATSLGKATQSGFNAAQRAIKAILNPETANMPAALTPSIAARNKLKAIVIEMAQDPGKLNDINTNNPVEDYKQPFALTSSRAATYLNSIRPKDLQNSPLDTKIPPPPGEKASYDRQLDLAQNPNLILKHIKDGNIIPQDIKTVATIYPNYYQHLTQKLVDAAMEQNSRGKIIPYKTRIGMSLFLGRPLDSTMTPQSIMAAQPQSAIPQGQPQQTSKPSAASSQRGLQKLPAMYRTPSQASQVDKARRGER